VTAPVFLIDSEQAAAAAVGSVVRVTGPEGRHAVTVRRLGPGEPVALVDGCGARIDGIVRAASGKDVLEVEATAVRVEPRPRPTVTVVQALPKGDRGELAVELLTEIGVDLIVPWSAAHCVTHWRGDRVDRAWRRWDDAARAAAKQARRAWFPEVCPLATTAEVCARASSATLAIALHESAHLPIADVALPVDVNGDGDGGIVIIVGPEGGLAADELAVFAGAGALAVRLGPTVLRTSSAGMAAVAVLLASSPRWRDLTVEG
jgi:16S rRNA (uracil1498-N3)-methyltransferase